MTGKKTTRRIVLVPSGIPYEQEIAFPNKFAAAVAAIYGGKGAHTAKTGQSGSTTQAGQSDKSEPSKSNDS